MLAARIVYALSLLLGSTTSVNAALTAQTQVWKNVVIGAGGFVPGIVFSTKQPGLSFLRTDIGGAYRSNGDAWVPITDHANDTTWHDWGVESIATDPINSQILYLAVGIYTISWDPRNASILRSTDQGRNWVSYPLPFKAGGNMPGRGFGERLAIDPGKNSILFLGARSGNGLWKSIDSGATWANVTNFPDAGTYIQNPSDVGGYTGDKIGVGWVTFDRTTKKSTGTPRIFVGVATVGSSNVFMTNDGGSTWTALPTFANNTYMPKRGVLSPAESCLYVSFNNQGGPYDGSAGAVGKYNITSGTWRDITPQAGSFGFGGLDVDLQRPGTVMVANLNQWWPDANIFRSIDGGTTWSQLWTWGNYPTVYRHFGLDNSLAPYLGGPVGQQDLSKKVVGWMIEALGIDPFDSNHWLYGTGATLSGGHDLTNWDTPAYNVSISSLVAGVEETAVIGLISPTSGSHLLSVVGDIGGFNHVDLNKPSIGFTNPTWGTTTGIDYAGNKPSMIVRVANSDSGSSPQLATSSDGGATWAPSTAVPLVGGYSGGTVVYSANGDVILWATDGQGVVKSTNGTTFAPATGVPSGAVIAADKVNGTVLYAASGSTFYTSADSGATWKTSTPGNTTSPVWIAASPYKAGDIWLSGNGGVQRSSDYGKTWTTLGMVTTAWRIAVGKSQQPNGPTVVYVAGTIQGMNALYRTDDGGANWIQLSDRDHGFGSTSGLILAADPRIYKRVYVGTNGRGIFWTSDACMQYTGIRRPGSD